MVKNMNLIKKILNKFRKSKPEPEEIETLEPKKQISLSQKPIGYFNGACPECEEHIGIWVYSEKAYCPVCGTQIFKQIEALVELGRL